ncbi:unnamed protein product [Closterium sp. NIES-53]
MTAIHRLPRRKRTLVRVTACALLLLVVSSLSAHAADMKTRGGAQTAPSTQPTYTKPPTLPPSAPTSKSDPDSGSPFDQDPFGGSTPTVTPVDSDDPLSGEEDPAGQPPPTSSTTPAPNPPKESPPPTKPAPSQPKPSPVPAAPVNKPTSTPSTPSAPSSVVTQGTGPAGKSFGGSVGKSPVNQVGKTQTGSVNPKPKPKPSNGKVKASQADDDNDVIIGPATCLQSTLSGFTNSVNLTRLGGLSLHWKITSQSSIDFALEAKATSKGKSGWGAVGWSAPKSKFPSDLIIGNLPSQSVGAYDIYGYGAGSTLKSKSVHLSDTSIEKPGAGGFIARFTRSTDDGTVPVKVGPNRLIWAWSVKNSEDVALRKSRRGELVVDLTCAAGAQPVTTQSNPKSPKSPSPAKTSPPVVKIPAKSPSVPSKFPSIPPKSPTVPAKSPAKPSPNPPTNPAPKPGVTPAKNTSSGGGGSGGLKTGNSCDASALLGFTFSTPLVLNKLYLHWKIIGTDTLKVAVEAKSGTNVDNGWYGIGWSREGAMAPADAVLGNLAGGQVKAYMLGGYTKTGVQLSNRLALSNDRGTFTTGTGNTMFWFYRKVADGGLAPIMDLKTPSYIIWAYAQDMFQTVGYHGTNRGLHQIDFSCNQRPKVIMAPGSNKINDKDDDDN